MQVHVSGVCSKPYILSDKDITFNTSREKTKDLADLCHHLAKVESLERSLFFALRKSGADRADRVTVGLVQSSRNYGDRPVIVIPKDQGWVHQSRLSDF